MVIWENEYIKCYELSKKIGGKLIAIKTDNVICEVNNVEATLKSLRLNQDEIGGYKMGDIIEVREFAHKTNEHELNMKFEGWNEIYEEDFTDFDEISQHIIDKNKSLLIMSS